uniref:Uncharacterized protein n=1 Tax=Anopheles culicifacies TaxID=139723 RepID=A0A182MF19_9DIPT
MNICHAVLPLAQAMLNYFRFFFDFFFPLPPFPPPAAAIPLAAVLPVMEDASRLVLRPLFAVEHFAAPTEDSSWVVCFTCTLPVNSVTSTVGSLSVGSDVSSADGSLPPVNGGPSPYVSESFVAGADREEDEVLLLDISGCNSSSSSSPLSSSSSPSSSFVSRVAAMLMVVLGRSATSASVDGEASRRLEHMASIILPPAKTLSISTTICFCCVTPNAFSSPSKSPPTVASSIKGLSKLISVFSSCAAPAEPSRGSE